MKAYLTGKGFIGSKLLERVEATHIPHDKITETKLESYDFFYFLSSYGNLAHQTDEEAIFKANIEDLLSILKKSRKTKFKSFVYISSSSVKLRSQTTYSRTKKAAEEILLAFMERHNVPICIIRPTSVYGPEEQPIHLIPTILRSCFQGMPMNFVPEPTHDFIFIDDIVEGIINLSSNSARGIFELGTGIKTTNQEVLSIIEEISDKKANINVVGSMRNYDNQDWVSTNFKSRSWGWSPKTSLRDGLKKVIEDYLKNPAMYGIVEQ